MIFKIINFYVGDISKSLNDKKKGGIWLYSLFSENYLVLTSNCDENFTSGISNNKRLLVNPLKLPRIKIGSWTLVKTNLLTQFFSKYSTLRVINFIMQNKRSTNDDFIRSFD